MKYILSETGEIELDSYFDYLESISSYLSYSVKRFALDSDRYKLNNCKSLHDAWIDQITIYEKRQNPVPKCRVELFLLSQCHTRIIQIVYMGVIAYRLSGHQSFIGENVNKSTFHGDILTHEIRLNKKKKLVHEIIFHDKTNFKITCDDFEVTESNK